MDRTLLRKVQLTQLEILREVERVCRENDIQWFLCCGTLLGAVRHQGFIPWDDDLDIGMLRADYEKFCRLAPEKMDPRFCVQNWYTEPAYPLPFGKVRMRNTVYEEAKSRTFRENGFYIDVFPFDNAPEDPADQAAHAVKLNDLFRLKLMKSGYKPWLEKDRINWKKRIGYLFYQIKAVKYSQEELARRYDALAASYPDGTVLCRQRGLRKLECYPAEWFRELTELTFETEKFPGPMAYDAVLCAQFGDYMTPPPEESREDRHQIVRVDFGDGTEEWKI